MTPSYNILEMAKLWKWRTDWWLPGAKERVEGRYDYKETT